MKLLKNLSLTIYFHVETQITSILTSINKFMLYEIKFKF